MEISTMQHHTTLYVLGPNSAPHAQCRCGWETREAGTIEEILEAAQSHKTEFPEPEWGCALTDHLLETTEEFLKDRRLGGASITADHDHTSEDDVVIQFVIKGAEVPEPDPVLELEIGE